ncbi:hypothetical protein [Microbacterium sp. LWS13-1.2]|uniref:Lipoprotein n=1 Tax=Microbacterium sp. LWS13-1.2 TaxID=3135264 RepID=A0AAU6S8B3_9MICO
MRTRVTAAALGAILVLALAGCTTPEQPEPTPTPAFSSEEEAFAAAEATYRAYVDALNQVDLSDPETFEAVYELTTGEANANERKSLSQMHADGWTVAGDTGIKAFLGDSYSGETLQAVVCSDVAAVEVLDANGHSVVSADRPDVYALEVIFQMSPTTTSFVISQSTAVEDERCA